MSLLSLLSGLLGAIVSEHPALSSLRSQSHFGKKRKPYLSLGGRGLGAIQCRSDKSDNSDKSLDRGAG